VGESEDLFPADPVVGEIDRSRWPEDRVYCQDADGELFSLPAAWTDVAPADPFVVIAADRCPFTAEALLAVADLIDPLCPVQAAVRL
jgi:hypothetical protein